MKVSRVLFCVVLLALAAYVAGYFCAMYFRPANAHGVSIFGVGLPAGRYASATFTFAWAFLLAALGVCVTWQRYRSTRRNGKA